MEFKRISKRLANYRGILRTNSIRQHRAAIDILYKRQLSLRNIY